MSVTLFVRDDEAELNLSNVNFGALGRLIDEAAFEECGGEIAGEALAALKGRVQFALASLQAMPDLDGGTESHEWRGAGGCRAIECGRAEGYWQDRLPRLLAVIEAAERGDGVLHWG